jgi:hypothetical protein
MELRRPHKQNTRIIVPVLVIPAKAGTQRPWLSRNYSYWVPAFAGMTGRG